MTWRSLTRACRLAAVAAALLLVGAATAAAQERADDPPNEYEVKAAFLYNFAKFVEWPARVFAGRSAPIVIGVVGHDPFGDRLVDLTRGERVSGRAIEIRYYAPGEPLVGCHVLYVGVSDRRKLDEMLQQLKGRNVLTVSDLEEFTVAGGVIRLTKEDHRIGLEINLRAARQAELRISSRLLSLATIVDTEPTRGAR